MTIAFEAIREDFGAVVTGADLRQELAPECFRQI